MTKARSNATANAAKGDLTVGNGTNLSGVLAVGSNGDTIVADSSTATGLRYTAGTVQSNPVLNSAMQIWQRGTSVAGSTTAFSADRWQSYRAVAGSTFSRQVTNDTTNLPNIQYCLRVQRDSGNTSTTAIALCQNFETINSIPFAGKTVTLSFYARAGANFSQASSTLPVILYSGTGTDQNTLTGYAGQTAVITGNSVLTTTWQRFTYTGTVATSATELSIYVGNFVPVGTAGANDYYEITGVQIDIGSVALPFRTNAGTIQGELAACQRYYYRETGAEAGVVTTGFGQAYSTTNTYAIFKPKVTMRVTPTLIDYSNLRAENGISAINVTSASLWGASTKDAPAILNTTGGTFTTTTSWYIGFSAAGYIGFSAEL